MRRFTIAVVVLAVACPAVTAGPVTAGSGGDATAVSAKKKKRSCPRGYTRKSVKVKRKKRIHGKTKKVTVRVKRCVKKNKRGGSPSRPPISPIG
jgi:hypothetical protein